MRDTGNRRWALLLAIAGLLAAACSRQGARLDQPTPRVAAPRPNILFAIADDASFPHMGAYGADWIKTPTFDRVAREGLLFTRAYTPNAKCAPSRASVLTGRYSWQLEEAGNHIAFFPETFKTYPEALAERGYFVGRTGKGWGPGDPGTRNGARRELAGRGFDERKLPPPTTGISSNDYAGNFADFLAGKPADAPFCFWFGALEPHRRYEFQSGVNKGGKHTRDVSKVPGFLPDAEVVRHDLLDYALEIEHFDRHLGRMLALLEARGELHNTLVVITSDNGMPFPRAKGMSYEYSNHMPLAIMWPDGIRAPGRVVADFVSFVDFAPTFLALAGLRDVDVGMHATAGRSLTDVFGASSSGPALPGRDHVLLGKERHDAGRPHDQGYPIRGIIKGDLLYLRNFEPTRWPGGNPETGYLNCDGGPTKTYVLESRRNGRDERHWQWAFGKHPAEELYDLKRDPDCLHNLLRGAAHATVKGALAAQLEAELKAQGDPRMFGKGAIFDEYVIADPKSRGYYERYMSGQAEVAGWVNASDYESGPIEAP